MIPLQTHFLIETATNQLIKRIAILVVIYILYFSIALEIEPFTAFALPILSAVFSPPKAKSTCHNV
jgi:hypothetical protein